jgi:hypothetical protein
MEISTLSVHQKISQRNNQGSSQRISQITEISQRIRKRKRISQCLQESAK